jgi:hypothetical protein
MNGLKVGLGRRNYQNRRKVRRAPMTAKIGDYHEYEWDDDRLRARFSVRGQMEHASA